MNEKDKRQKINQESYKKERSDLGESYQSHPDRRVHNAAKTTIRLQLTKREVWLGISLLKALGRDPTEMSFVRVFQLLVESLLTSKVNQGLIEDISNAEAIQRLNEFQQIHIQDIGDVSLEGLNELKQIEKETSTEIRQTIGEALDKVQNQKDLQGIEDLLVPDLNIPET